MKAIKNIIKNNGLARLVALFAVVFGANVFSMKMTPAGQRSAKQFMIKLKKDQMRNELIAADWSQEKIKEFRQKRDLATKDRMNPKGKLVYPVTYTRFSEPSPMEKAFNGMLIDHYAQEIYAALQAVPVNERAAWAGDFHLIVTIGLKDYLKDGRKRYLAGALSTISWADDGSEIGRLGTKYEALKKVKSETNDLVTIPFDATVAPMTPVDFFKSL
jgi:hypothetical protein